MHFREFPSLAKAAVLDWMDDKASRHAAAMSYYAIFSIAPLLLIAIAVAGAVYGEAAARGAIAQELGRLIGEDGARAVQDMVAAADKPMQGLVATVIGVAALLLGASGGFQQLQESLNAIWEVQTRPGRGLKGMVKDRLVSFSMVLVIALLLLVSMFASAGISAMGAWLGSFLPYHAVLLRLGEIGLSLTMGTLIFAALFKILPDVRIRWSDVWIGALATAALFALGRYLIGLYLGRTAFGSAYGAAGSLVIFLVWINYSFQIFFFGAEFTQVYAARFGSGVVPDRDALEMPEAPLRPGPATGASARAGKGPPARELVVRAEPAGMADAAPEAPPREGRYRVGTRRVAGGAAGRVVRGGFKSAAITLSLAYVVGRSALDMLSSRARRLRRA